MGLFSLRLSSNRERGQLIFAGLFFKRRSNLLVPERRALHKRKIFMGFIPSLSFTSSRAAKRRGDPGFWIASLCSQRRVCKNISHDGRRFLVFCKNTFLRRDQLNAEPGSYFGLRSSDVPRCMWQCPRTPLNVE